MFKTCYLTCVSGAIVCTFTYNNLLTKSKMIIRTRVYYAPDPFAYINYSVTIVKDRWYSILHWTVDERDVKELASLTKEQDIFLSKYQEDADTELKEKFAEMEVNGIEIFDYTTNTIIY